jgi:hypothetical protein
MRCTGERASERAAMLATRSAAQEPGRAVRAADKPHTCRGRAVHTPLYAGAPRPREPKPRQTGAALRRATSCKGRGRAGRAVSRGVLGTRRAETPCRGPRHHAPCLRRGRDGRAWSRAGTVRRPGVCAGGWAHRGRARGACRGSHGCARAKRALQRVGREAALCHGLGAAPRARGNRALGPSRARAVHHAEAAVGPWHAPEARAGPRERGGTGLGTGTPRASQGPAPGRRGRAARAGHDGRRHGQAARGGRGRAVRTRRKGTGKREMGTRETGTSSPRRISNGQRDIGRTVELDDRRDDSFAWV